MSNFYRFTLALLLFAACQGTERQYQPETARDPKLPQMIKITLQSPDQADSLIQAGVDVVVVEDTYVVARIKPNDLSVLNASSLTSVNAEETDFVQRLIKVIKHDENDLTTFAEMGLDIWEVKADTVLAQAFDKHIMQLQAQGFSVQIVEQDVNNYIKKQTSAK